MQKHYHHSVKPGRKVEQEHPGQLRVAIVFRDGKFCMFDKDSGNPPSTLNPRPTLPAPVTGNNIMGLEEGSTYSHQKLLNMRAIV